MEDREEEEEFSQELSNQLGESLPERPLDCCECKKKIAICYTEIQGDSCVETSMCADCPELQRRLRGSLSDLPVATSSDIASGLACGSCETTLEGIKRGHPLGCSECYLVFEDMIQQELEASGKVPAKWLPLKKGAALYMGKIPGEQLIISPSSRLLALNEALKETLNREDYEQAALLRDQIKAITDQEKKDEP